MTRTMLFSGCWAVRVEPPVWVWKRSIFDRSSLAPKRSDMMRAHIRLAARYLAISSNRLLCAFQKKTARREGVDIHARRDGRLHVGDAVRQGEGDLLHGRRAGLADVVARDGDGVPVGQVCRAVGEGVDDEAHGRPRRVDVGAPRDVLLQDVVLDGAADLLARHALLLGDQLVEQQQDGAGGVDGHGRRDRVQREVRPSAAACRPASRWPRRPCRLRPRPGGGRSRSPSASAGRRRTRDRSVPRRGGT